MIFSIREERSIPDSKISSHSGVERVMMPIIGQKRLLLDSLQKIKQAKGIKPSSNPVKDYIEGLSHEQLMKEMNDLDLILGRHPSQQRLKRGNGSSTMEV